MALKKISLRKPLMVGVAILLTASGMLFISARTQYRIQNNPPDRAQKHGSQNHCQ